MNGNIKEIIQQAKWEIKTLGEISDGISSGGDIRERHLGTGNHPVIRNTISKLPRKLYKIGELVDPDLISNKKYCEYGDIVISVGGDSNLARNCVYLGTEKCFLGGSVLVVKHSENPNFLSWALTSSQCKKEMRKNSKGHGFAYIEREKLAKTKVPIPPRHVQELIADFLDELEENIKGLESRLAQEIKYRQKQYHYYMNWLLESGEMKALEKVIKEICRESNVTSKHLGTGDYPAIRNNLCNLPRKLYECVDFVDPDLIKKKNYCEYGDIVICLTGSVGRNCVYFGKEKCIVGRHLSSIKHEEDPNFLSWALTCSECHTQIKKCSKRATIDEISAKDLLKIQVPIVPKEDQSEVADILDELFEAQRLLEKALELRQIQFKYYRDSLIWDELPTNF